MWPKATSPPRELDVSGSDTPDTLQIHHIHPGYTPDTAPDTPRITPDTPRIHPGYTQAWELTGLPTATSPLQEPE